MEPTTSESEQDGGVTSGEDNSFEHPSVSNSGNSETDSQFGEQVPYRTSAVTATPGNYAGMMIPSSYLPFMMPQSYQSAIQGTSAAAATSVPYAAAAANAFFFNQNSLAKDAEGLATSGSPLNLQMAGGQTDRQRIGSSHSDFNGATVQQQQQHSLARASPSPGLQHARASPHVVTGSSSYASPAHQNAYTGVAGNQLLGQSRFHGDTVYAKTDGAPKLSDYPPPPKRPLTPYMRFSRFVSQLISSNNIVYVCVAFPCNESHNHIVSWDLVC